MPLNSEDAWNPDGREYRIQFPNKVLLLVEEYLKRENPKEMLHLLDNCIAGIWADIVDHTDDPQCVAEVLMSWDNSELRPGMVSDLMWLLDGRQSLRKFKAGNFLQEQKREVLRLTLEDYLHMTV